jgi:hypothetical protein
VSIPTILIIVALILALVDEFRAQGQSLTAWAVVFLAIALLIGRIG